MHNLTFHSMSKYFCSYAFWCFTEPKVLKPFYHNDGILSDFTAEFFNYVYSFFNIFNFSIFMHERVEFSLIYWQSPPTLLEKSANWKYFGLYLNISYGNTPTKHWTSYKKIRNFWNEIAEKIVFLFPTVCIFTVCILVFLKIWTPAFTFYF